MNLLLLSIPLAWSAVMTCFVWLLTSETGKGAPRWYRATLTAAALVLTAMTAFTGTAFVRAAADTIKVPWL